MKSYFDNLRPFEKRLVVGVAAMVFVVLNVAFVFPHFSDWNKLKWRMEQAQNKLNKYETKIAQIPELEGRVTELQKGGAFVPPEDVAADFQRAVQLEAGSSRVNITSINRMSTSTNDPFFLEQSLPLSVQSGEEELVSFLYNLGNSKSLIRVRGLNLKPDQPRQALTANLTLVASYQKKPVTKPAAPAPGRTTTPAPRAPVSAAKAAPASKPITATAK